MILYSGIPQQLWKAAGSARGDVAQRGDRLAFAESVCGGADVLPAESFVQPNRGLVLVHDVEHQRPCLLLGVRHRRADELFTDAVPSSCGADEEASEHQGIGCRLTGLLSPEGGSVVGFGGGRDKGVPDDRAAEFARPCLNQSGRPKPSDRVGNAFDRVAVELVNLDEKVGHSFDRRRPHGGGALPKRRARDSDERLLTRDEVRQQLLPAVRPERYRALVACAAFAGLCLDAVDLDNGFVHVIRTVTEVAGHVEFKPYPKSRAGRRTIPIPQWLTAELRDHIARHEQGLHGLIFTNEVGGPLRRTLFRTRVWRPPWCGPAFSVRSRRWTGSSRRCG